MESIEIGCVELKKEDSDFSYERRFDFDLFYSIIHNSQVEFTGLDGNKYLLIDHWICIEVDNEVVVIEDLGHYWRNNPFSKELVIPDEVSRVDSSLLLAWHRWDKEIIDRRKAFGMSYKTDEYVRFEKIYIGSKLEYTPSINEYISNCYNITISKSNPNYKIVDGCIISVCNCGLIKYIGFESNLTIPYGVRVILESAFKTNDVTSLVMPNTVVDVACRAIANCNSLKSIVFHGAVTIFSHGICECNNLETILFYGPMCIMSNGIFGCGRLINIICEQEGPKIAADGISFCNSIEHKYSDSEDVIFKKTYIKSKTNRNIVNIPKGIIYVGSFAFLGCTELKTLFIPNTVTDVGEGICNKCSGLENIILEDGISLECAKSIVEKWYRIERKGYMQDNPFRHEPGVYSIYVPDELYLEILNGRSSIIEHEWETGSYSSFDHADHRTIVHIVKKSELAN